jgi:hypothetical protein
MKNNKENKTVLACVFEEFIVKYKIGQLVYLRNDNQQIGRFVTGIIIRQTGISYGLSCNSDESWHYDFEISKTRDLVKSFTE